MGNQCHNKCSKSSINEDELIVRGKTEISENNKDSSSLRRPSNSKMPYELKSHCKSPVKPFGLVYYPQSIVKSQEDQNQDDIQSSMQSKMNSESNKYTDTDMLNHQQQKLTKSQQKKFYSHDQQVNHVPHQQKEKNKPAQRLKSNGYKKNLALIPTGQRVVDSDRQRGRGSLVEGNVSQSPIRSPKRSPKQSSSRKSTSKIDGSELYCATTSPQKNALMKRNKKKHTFVLQVQQNQTEQKFFYTKYKSQIQQDSQNDRDNSRNRQIEQLNQKPNVRRNSSRESSNFTPLGILKNRSQKRNNSIQSSYELASHGYGSVGRQVRFKDQQKRK